MTGKGSEMRGGGGGVTGEGSEMRGKGDRKGE